MEKQTIQLKVNGEDYELSVPPSKTLLEVLREDLGLTGAKEGCQDGTCGSCTVLIDGKPIRSCIYLAVEAKGKDILTIEGLAKGEDLHPIQEAFVNHGGVQCGYCTSGMILTAKALLDTNPDPIEAEVRQAISGNLCRCTGYVKIVASIMAAAEKSK
jgi:carbon-monoxide dehydrogenase small subunit